MKRSWLARHPVGFMALYSIFYLSVFHYLESNVPLRSILVHCRLDDLIPFCKYAVIPYFAWFVWIPFTLFYLLWKAPREDFWRLCLPLFAGMTNADGRCDAPLLQGDDYRSGGIDKARATATAVLDGAYGYHHGPVLFKPTLAGGEQTFRINQEGALAYFVGNNQAYPADTGFALKNWQSYNYDNAAVYINGDMALTMGKVHLTDRDNKQTTVDKTWGFKKGDDGKVRIVLHHSSLPYAG